jgi:hypothetical protein
MSSVNGRSVFRVLLRRILIAPVLLHLALPYSAFAKPKKLVPTARWTRNGSGCSFTRTPDGKYVYGITVPEFDLSVAMDSQVLNEVKQRIEPFIGVFVEIHYLGSTKLPFGPELASLEFVDHSHVVQNALDPDSLSLRVQMDVEQIEDDTERDARKHPEQREEQERRLQIYKKEVSDLQDFLSRHTLNGTELDPANSEASGWVLFSTRSKWIGDWKNPEEFVLRFRWRDRAVEFPFSLPPQPGDLILRERKP